MIDSNFLRAVIVNQHDPEQKDYSLQVPAINSLSELELHSKITYFVGENGSGKSTLLEAIAISAGFNPEGGTLNIKFATQDTHSNLHESIRLIRGVKRPKDGFFLRAESLYSLSSQLDTMEKDIYSSGVLSSYGSRSLHEQSHGESLLAILKHRINRPGLYLFDEPETAFSPQRQMALLVKINDLLRIGSQFIIATHSPIVLAHPDSWIYEFGAKGIKRLKYEETEVYRVSQDFINRREMIMDELLK